MNLTSGKLQNFKNYEVGQILKGNIERGRDLKTRLEEIIKEAGIEAGYVQVLGAVRCARLGYFNQNSCEYEYHNFDEPVEIINCSGNISLSTENEPTLHAHMVVSDKSGKAYGGHLETGTEVYVGETIIQEFKGEPHRRSEDPESGLTLWSY